MLGKEVEEQLVAGDIKQYISLAVHAAHSISLRDVICSKKTDLFGAKVLEDSVQDWGDFLITVSHI